MSTTTISDLQSRNPWKDLDYDVANIPDGGWVCDADKKAIAENGAYKMGKNKGQDRFRLSINPVPWAGRWYGEVPRLVILGTNPGSGYDNDNNDGRSLMKGDGSDDEFSHMQNRILRGESGLAEQIFSKAVFSRSGYTKGKKGKKVSYWVERLHPLYREVVANPLTKDEIYSAIQDESTCDAERLKQAKDFFDSVLTVEAFPYHTKYAAGIGPLYKDDKPVYPSSAFNVELVRYLISQGVMVIAARSVDFWEPALGKDFKKCLRHNNPQQIYITKNNLVNKFNPERVWKDLVKKLTED